MLLLLWMLLVLLLVLLRTKQPASAYALEGDRAAQNVFTSRGAAAK